MPFAPLRLGALALRTRPFNAKMPRRKGAKEEAGGIVGTTGEDNWLISAWFEKLVMNLLPEAFRSGDSRKHELIVTMLSPSLLRLMVGT